jgi:hypothetical protein
MNERDFQTDNDIEHHFGDDDELDPLSAAMADKIDFLVDDRFPGVADDIGLIISRAQLRYGFEPKHPEVVKAIHKQMGSKVKLDDLEGISDVEMNRLRQRALEDGEDSTILEAIGVWAMQWESYQQELIDLEPSELMERYSAAVASVEAELHEMDARHDVLSFINEPNARADFEYWGVLPSWTLHEAVALSFDKNPEQVNLESIKKYRAVASHSPFVRQFMQRLHLVERAVAAGHLENLTSPRNFSRWALTENLPLGTDFSIWAHSNSHGGADHSVQNGDDAWSDPRVRSTLYKMFFGMAVAKYGLDPQFGADDRSPVFSRIAADLLAVGLEVDTKTVRKHAKLARGVFSNMVTPPAIRAKRT